MTLNCVVTPTNIYYISIIYLLYIYLLIFRILQDFCKNFVT